jgi:heat shock protein HslJ
VVEPSVALGGTEWMLAELAGAPVELGEADIAPHLVLDLEESRVTGSTGCNRLVGSFALSEDELRFGALATTRMACLEHVMQRETVFLAALARVTSYELEGSSLTLLEGADAIVRLSSRSDVQSP